MAEDKIPWYDDDLFWKKMRPFMFSDLLIEVASAEVDGLIKLLDIKKDDLILDLSCGIGRHSNEFARRGYEVTGVDRTGFLLDEAIEAAQKEKLSVEYIQEDMRVFRRPESFDVVLSMNTSFGFFEDNKEQYTVLDNVYTSLKSGGRFVIQTIGKEKLARIFQEKSWRETEAGILATERRPIDDWGKMQNIQNLIETDGTRYKWEMTHHLYSAVELKSLLTSAGFESVKAFGNFDGSSYDQLATKLVVVGVK